MVSVYGLFAAAFVAFTTLALNAEPTPLAKNLTKVYMKQGTPVLDQVMPPSQNQPRALPKWLQRWEALELENLHNSQSLSFLNAYDNPTDKAMVLAYMLDKSIDYSVYDAVTVKSVISIEEVHKYWLSEETLQNDATQNPTMIKNGE